MEKEDKRLKEILQEGHEHDSPSMSFTANIMRELDAKRTARLKPIIGKWAWILIIVFFLAMVSIPLMSHWATLYSDTVDLVIPHVKLGLIIVLMSSLFIIFDEFFLRKRKVNG